MGKRLTFQALKRLKVTGLKNGPFWTDTGEKRDQISDLIYNVAFRTGIAAGGYRGMRHVRRAVLGILSFATHLQSWSAMGIWFQPAASHRCTGCRKMAAGRRRSFPKPCLPRCWHRQGLQRQRWARAYAARPLCIRRMKRRRMALCALSWGLWMARTQSLGSS